MEEDILAWNLEKTGMYTVRSAYRLLKAEQSQEMCKENETVESKNTTEDTHILVESSQ
jgi:hypothetical protein